MTSRMHACMDVCNYGRYTTALGRSLYEPPKTLQQEAAGIWPEIVEETYRWEHVRDLAYAVKAVTAEELRELFDTHIACGGPQRRKVSSHYFSQKDDAADGASAPEAAAPAEGGAAAAA